MMLIKFGPIEFDGTDKYFRTIELLNNDGLISSIELRAPTVTSVDGLTDVYLPRFLALTSTKAMDGTVSTSGGYFKKVGGYLVPCNKHGILLGGTNENSKVDL